MKNHFRSKNLPDPISIREAASKTYVDNLFDDPSVLTKSSVTAHIDLNDRSITNARFIQVNQKPQIDSHLTTKLYVDNAIVALSLARNNQDKYLNNHNLTIINSITVNTEAVNDNQVIIKAYVAQFHDDNERNRRDFGLSFYDEEVDLVKNNQDNDLNDKKFTNLDSFVVNREPTSDFEISNKKFIDDELDKLTILRFSQTLENYWKVSVGNDTYYFTI